MENNENLIPKLVVYLQDNGLVQDLYSKLYYVIEKLPPNYQIKYYKSKINGKLLSMNDVKNSYDFLKYYLEDYIVYAYEERKTLYFKNEEVSTVSVRRQADSKSYGYSVIINEMLNKNNDCEDVDWVNIINKNPLLFGYIISEYNINIDELKNTVTKSCTYTK